MSEDLAKLVDRGDIAAAVRAAQGLTPERVRPLLFSGGGFMKDSKPYAEFISRWYQSLSSANLAPEIFKSSETTKS
ncbi:hypothetical protein ACT3TP_15340, partial [Glutamicibacter sp. AOP38-B1-38]|uniref:hypothetical protein n=1 Tax=Glutamicibacter sp. AOP38-B1-38 TaxID=3457680 RepID=UPI0040349DB6